MLKVYLDAIGLASPGLHNWQSSQPVLCGATYAPEALEKYKPTQLPTNEARRATELVRMAFRICEEVMTSSNAPLQNCATVFSSSGGDYPIIDQICRSLCEPERLVSPTQFHNSVHNSAAGYWSIATGSRLPSTSLSAHDDSFAAGLLEAMCLCQDEQHQTLLAVYDIKTPSPLSQKRNISVEFGVALLLSPAPTPHSIAQLNLTLCGNTDQATPASDQLENLRKANPAARSLPLLELIAQKRSGIVIFNMLNQNNVQLEVVQC